MSAKLIKKCSIASFILLLVYFLFILFNQAFSSFVQEIVDDLKIFYNPESMAILGNVSHVMDGYLPHETALILALLIPTGILLSYAKKENNLHLIRTSKISLIAGWVYFAVSIVNWILCIVSDFYHKYLYYKYPMKLSEQDIVPENGAYITQIDVNSAYYEAYDRFMNIEYSINTVCNILTVVTAIVMLVMFFVSMTHAANKRLQFKAEAAKPFVCTMLLIPQTMTCVRIVIDLLYRIGIDSDKLIDDYMNILGICNFSIQLLTLAALVYFLVFGIIKKTKGAEAQETSSDDVIYIHAENLID